MGKPSRRRAEGISSEKLTRDAAKTMSRVNRNIPNCREWSRTEEWKRRPRAKRKKKERRTKMTPALAQFLSLSFSLISFSLVCTLSALLVSPGTLAFYRQPALTLEARGSRRWWRGWRQRRMSALRERRTESGGEGRRRRRRRKRDGEEGWLWSRVRSGH